MVCVGGHSIVALSMSRSMRLDEISIGSAFGKMHHLIFLNRQLTLLFLDNEIITQSKEIYQLEHTEIQNVAIEIRRAQNINMASPIPFCSLRVAVDFSFVYSPILELSSLHRTFIYSGRQCSRLVN